MHGYCAIAGYMEQRYWLKTNIITVNHSSAWHHGTNTVFLAFIIVGNYNLFYDKHFKIVKIHVVDIVPALKTFFILASIDPDASPYKLWQFT